MQRQGTDDDELTVRTTNTMASEFSTQMDSLRKEFEAKMKSQQDLQEQNNVAHVQTMTSLMDSQAQMQQQLHSTQNALNTTIQQTHALLTIITTMYQAQQSGTALPPLPEEINQTLQRPAILLPVTPDSKPPAKPSSNSANQEGGSPPNNNTNRDAPNGGAPAS